MAVYLPTSATTILKSLRPSFLRHNNHRFHRGLVEISPSQTSFHPFLHPNSTETRFEHRYTMDNFHITPSSSGSSNSLSLGLPSTWAAWLAHYLSTAQESLNLSFNPDDNHSHSAVSRSRQLQLLSTSCNRIFNTRLPLARAASRTKARTAASTRVSTRPDMDNSKPNRAVSIHFLVASLA